MPIPSAASRVARRARTPVRSTPELRWPNRLLAWYRRHGRDLPWRRTRDPYRVWISEVMLQQTQVATALPYYDAFLERFPTLAALARAHEDDVLAAWSGLGYYRRARHLRAAAQTVVRDHRGRVPDDPVRFGALPGVGRYTTGAVLSICFDRPLAVLDGNVARVLSRLYALPASVKTSSGARRLWALADTLVPMRRPGEWNQALMELGARVCTPRNPRCGACPVRDGCRALALGKVEVLPPATPREPAERARRVVALIARGSRVLMVRRRGSQLDGLWEPPGSDVPVRTPPARVRETLRRDLARLGVRASLAPTGLVVKHTITRRAYTVDVWRGSGRVRRGAEARWLDAADARVGLTGLARKLMRLE